MLQYGRYNDTVYFRLNGYGLSDVEGYGLSFANG